MTDEDEVIVVGGHIRNVPVAGSVRGRCVNNADHQVWLSPASQVLIDAGATLYCWPCYRALPEDNVSYKGESPEGVRRLYAGELPLRPA